MGQKHTMALPVMQVQQAHASDLRSNKKRIFESV